MKSRINRRLYHVFSAAIATAVTVATMGLLAGLTGCGVQSHPPSLDKRWIGARANIHTPAERADMSAVGAYTLGLIGLKNLDTYVDIAETPVSQFSGNAIMPEIDGTTILPTCATVTPSTSKASTTYKVDSTNCQAASQVSSQSNSQLSLQWNSIFSTTANSSGGLLTLTHDPSTDNSIISLTQTSGPSESAGGGAVAGTTQSNAGSNSQRTISQRTTPKIKRNNLNTIKTLTISNEAISVTNQPVTNQSATDESGQTGIYDFSYQSTIEYSTGYTNSQSSQPTTQKDVKANVTIKGMLNLQTPNEKKIEFTTFNVEYETSGQGANQSIRTGESTGEIALQNPQATFSDFTNGVPVESITFNRQQSQPQAANTQNQNSQTQSASNAVIVSSTSGVQTGNSKINFSGSSSARLSDMFNIAAQVGQQM